MSHKRALLFQQAQARYDDHNGAHNAYTRWRWRDGCICRNSSATCIHSRITTAAINITKSKRHTSAANTQATHLKIHIFSSLSLSKTSVADAASAAALARLRLACAHSCPRMKNSPSSSSSKRPKAERPCLQYHHLFARFGVGSNPQDELQNDEDMNANV